MKSKSGYSNYLGLKLGVPARKTGKKLVQQIIDEEKEHAADIERFL
jgi:hypothetical protein